MHVWVVAKKSSGAEVFTVITHTGYRCGLIADVRPAPPENGQEMVYARIEFDHNAGGRDIYERIQRGELIQ